MRQRVLELFLKGDFEGISFFGSRKGPVLQVLLSVSEDIEICGLVEFEFYLRIEATASLQLPHAPEEGF